jgi:transcriptional regulator with XRE-family HTH domain
MSASKDEQVAWVKAVATHLGVSLTELARRAKLAPSTLQRPVNDADFPGMMSGRTLAAVAEAAGLAVLEYPARLRGVAEADAVPFRYDEAIDTVDGIDRAVRELCRGRAGRDPWQIRSYALELLGILPGDILIVGLNRQPKPRDVVCAQIYDWSGMKSETVFRYYDPPYLLTHSSRIAPEKPVPVDGENVVIKGVVEYVLRRAAR